MRWMKLLPMMLWCAVAAWSAPAPAAPAEDAPIYPPAAAIDGAPSDEPPLDEPQGEPKDDRQSLAGAVFDRTDQLLQELREEGLRELESVEIGSDKKTRVTLHLAITAKAQAVLDRAAPGGSADATRFTRYLSGVFSDSVLYFEKIVPAPGVREFYMVIDDMGKAGNSTISASKTNSRLILGDVRRWQRLYRGRQRYADAVSSIHEFTHLVNYVLDPREIQQHRELTAIIFELMNYAQKADAQEFSQTYLRQFTWPLQDPDEILDPRYSSNNVLRIMAHFFFRKVLDGTYEVDGQPAPTLQRFAALYLSNPLTGDRGFDAACAEAKIFYRGLPLTLDVVRTSAFDELNARNRSGG